MFLDNSDLFLLNVRRSYSDTLVKVWAKKINFRNFSAIFSKKVAKSTFFRNRALQLLRCRNFSKCFKYVQKLCANVSYIHKEPTPQISAKSDFSTILSCTVSTRSQKYFAPEIKIKLPSNGLDWKKIYSQKKQLAMML